MNGRKNKHIIIEAIGQIIGSGGGEVVFKKILTHLALLYCDTAKFTVLISKGQENLLPVSIREKLNIVSVPKWTSYSSLLTRVYGQLCLPLRIYFSQELKTYDVLFGLFSYIPIFLRGPKAVFFQINVFGKGFKKTSKFQVFRSKIRQYFAKIVLTHSDIIFCASNAHKEELLQGFGPKLSKKIKVVYLGVDPIDLDYHLIKKRFSNHPIWRTIENFKNYIIYPSVIRPYKNHETLIKAFNILKKDPKYKDYKLIFAGGKAIDNDFWEYLLKLDKTNSIIYLGHIDHDLLMYLISRAKLMVFPSLYEGFGIPIIEAFYLRVPVVASDVYPIKEIADDAAILFNPYDPNDLVRKIKTVLENTELRNLLVAKGYKRAMFFKWENTAKMIYENLKSLIT